jgi:antitoxin StbD
MNHNPTLKSIMNFIVPISRFNRGEANKIFEEVSENGVKVVMKNNVPACVLVTPERYEEMVEMLEDYSLFFEAEERVKNAEVKGYIRHDQLLSELGFKESDLDDGLDVDIE